ncbi:MAG: hypothetical protein QXR16_01675 [Candidatus Micrarchaeaceae archaeon]
MKKLYILTFAATFMLTLFMIPSIFAHLPTPLLPTIILQASNVASCPTTVNALAPWYCSQINQAVYKAWAPWLPIALIVILVSFMIGVMIFMAGIIANNERIRSFGIGEIYEAIATAIIVIMFMLIAAVMFGLIPSFAVGPIDPYNTSLTYINRTINVTEAVFKSLYDSNMLASYYASISISIAVEGQNVASTLSSIISPLYSGVIEVLYVLPSYSIDLLLMDGILVLETEFHLILLFMYAAIPVFLIPGIILRAIFPTRSLGGMMIALAIGFYMIMPILFAIAYVFTSQSVLQTMQSEAAAINAYGSGTGSQSNAVSPTSPLVLELGDIQSSMGAFWLSVLFYPALIIAMTYAMVTQIANFIGGFAQKSGKLLTL